MIVEKIANMALLECGNPANEILSFETALKGVVSAYLHYRRQAYSAGEKDAYDIVGEPFSVSVQEGTLPTGVGENFRRGSRAEIRMAGASTYDDLLVVNLETVNQSEYYGEYAIAFYGNSPVKYKLSFDPSGFGSVMMRLTYPSEALNLASLADEVDLPVRFHDMLALRAVLDDCLPVMAMAEDTKIDRFIAAKTPVLIAKLQAVETQWNFELFESEEEQDYQPTPINRGRTFRVGY